MLLIDSVRGVCGGTDHRSFQKILILLQVIGGPRFRNGVCFLLPPEGVIAGCAAIPYARDGLLARSNYTI